MNEDTAFDDGHSDLVKSVHGLFGFVVEESIVVLFLDENFRIDGHIRVDNKVDLFPKLLQKVQERKPEPGAFQHDFIVLSYSKNMARANQALKDFLTLFFADEHAVLEAIFTDGETIWETLSGDAGVISMMPNDVEIMRAMDGKFNYASRESAIASLHERRNDPFVSSMIEKIISQCPKEGQDMEHWRQSILSFAEKSFTEDDEPAVIASMVMCAVDPVMRDITVENILSATGDHYATMSRWKEAFIRTPERYRMMVAEVFAWSALVEGSRWFLPELLPYCDPESENAAIMTIFFSENRVLADIAQVMADYLNENKCTDLGVKFSLDGQKEFDNS